MEVTTEAARKGLSLFDDRWAVGLWTFSTLLDGPKDYKELGADRPLSAQRAQLLQRSAGSGRSRTATPGSMTPSSPGTRRCSRAGMTARSTRWSS
jgi:hypothetical protein